MTDKQRKTAIGRPVQHGIYSFLRTGKINPSLRGFKRIQKYLRDIERDLIADMGGPDNLTAGREVLVKSTVQAYGVLLLAGAYTQRYSILNPVQARRGVIELQPVLGKQYIAFLNTVRQNLALLGIDRKRAEDALTIQEVIREFDQRKGDGAEEKRG